MREIISIVLPAYNEEESLEITVKDILDFCKTAGVREEIIIVDDGSTDSTGKIAENLSNGNNVRVLHNKINRGKSNAIFKGFREAKGDIVFVMDADHQHSAKDIEKFLDKIEEGYDAVNGWRKNRKDPPTKTIPSKIFNFLTRRLVGINLHDFNCGFKAFRREVLDDFLFNDGQHRYLMALAHSEGYQVGEVEVEHYPRRHGSPKFNSPLRLLDGFLDLLSLGYQVRYMKHPMMFFGGIGLLFLGLGSLLSFYLVYLHFTVGIGDRPLQFLTVLLVIVGFQMFSLGFIADMVMSAKSELADIKSKIYKKPD